MRWSDAFIPTLREDPGDAEALSHRLLVRAGYIRRLMAGAWSLLPLAMRVRSKIAAVIREEMNAIGGQEFLLPAIHPAELWKRSGRWEIMGEEMFRLRDRRNTDLVLGMTHEEVFTTLALEISSYKQLPQIWYQIQTKFRDEPRPKSGLLRTREFTMKDSYSFDIDRAGLARSFELHRAAYTRIFQRLGLDAVAVEGSSGAMGGSQSVEFMVPALTGEDEVVGCPNVDYAANMERAVARLDVIADPEPPDVPEPFPTPGIKTIADLAAFDAAAPAHRQIKTLVYVADSEPVLVLLRGDHEMVEQKLADATGAIQCRRGSDDEIRELLGAGAGSLGAVGVAGVTIIADEALRGRTSMVTGANRDDEHLRGVDVSRDVDVEMWADLRRVTPGEPCPRCGAPLEVFRAIECGHIFQLGSRYARALGAQVQDPQGQMRTLEMGSYGIGLERNLAAIVEVYHDDSGITWPLSVAPYEVVISVIRPDDPATLHAAARLAENLESARVEVLLDDRPERPGVKLTDADLIGIPFRVTVGPRGLETGTVEFSARVGGATETFDLNEAASAISERLAATRS